MAESKCYIFENEFKDVTIPCRCAKQFMSALDNIVDQTGNWIFRGQIDSSWTLLPSVMREDFALRDRAETALEDYIKRGGRRSSEVREEQNDQNEKWYERLLGSCMEIERELVEDFVQLADSVELKLPQANYSEHWDPIRYGLTARQKLSERILQPEYVALAQHHRVPTRLLDFTYSHMTAAFFAAFLDERYKRSREKRMPEKMVVWAIDKDRLVGRIKTVQHLYSENIHLSRQRGVFLQDAKANDSFMEGNGNWMPFEKELFRLIESPKGIYRVTLFYRHKDALLDHLQKRGVSKLTLMPTLDNAPERAVRNIDALTFVDPADEVN